MSMNCHKRASAHGIDLYMHAVNSVSVYVLYRRTKDGPEGLLIYSGDSAPIITPRREFYKAFEDFIQPWMGAALDALPTDRDAAPGSEVVTKAVAARDAIADFTRKHMRARQWEVTA